MFNYFGFQSLSSYSILWFCRPKIDQSNWTLLLCWGKELYFKRKKKKNYKSNWKSANLIFLIIRCLLTEVHAEVNNKQVLFTTCGDPVKQTNNYW